MVMRHQTKETALVIHDWSDIPDNFTGVIFNNIKKSFGWLVSGEWHRDDGPAIQGSNGVKLWYLKGFPYLQEKWFNALTLEQKEKAVWNMDQW